MTPDEIRTMFQPDEHGRIEREKVAVLAEIRDALLALDNSISYQVQLLIGEFRSH